MRSNNVWVIQLLIFASLIGQCARAADKQPETTVRLGSFSRAVARAPYLVAKQKHLFENAVSPYNAKISYEEFQTLPSVNEAFASKKIDAVFEAETPCLVGKAAGIDLKIIAVAALASQPILVRKDSGINKLSEIRGKKVAVLAGSSANYVLLKLLEKAGLSKNDISILDMTPPDAQGAFDSNKIDAWAIWSPFIEQEELSGIGKVIPNSSGNVVVVMVARSEFIKENPKIVKALIDALNSARHWVSKHPAESEQIVSQELKIPLAVVQKAWPRQNWTATIDNPLLNDIQEKADFLKLAGFARNRVDVKDLVLSSEMMSSAK